MLVWMGDFNYRIDCIYEEAKELVRRNDLQALLAKVGFSLAQHHCMSCHALLYSLPCFTALQRHRSVKTCGWGCARDVPGY
jgi:hypothetical protein